MEDVWPWSWESQSGPKSLPAQKFDRNQRIIEASENDNDTGDRLFRKKGSASWLLKQGSGWKTSVIYSRKIDSCPKWGMGSNVTDYHQTVFRWRESKSELLDHPKEGIPVNSVEKQRVKGGHFYKRINQNLKCVLKCTYFSRELNILPNTKGLNLNRQ